MTNLGSTHISGLASGAVNHLTNQQDIILAFLKLNQGEWFTIPQLMEFCSVTNWSSCQTMVRNLRKRVNGRLNVIGRKNQIGVQEYRLLEGTYTPDRRPKPKFSYVVGKRSYKNKPAVLEVRFTKPRDGVSVAKGKITEFSITPGEFSFTAVSGQHYTYSVTDLLSFEVFA